MKSTDKTLLALIAHISNNVTRLKRKTSTNVRKEKSSKTVKVNHMEKYEFAMTNSNDIASDGT